MTDLTDDFPPFSPAFSPGPHDVPPYLKLLNLGDGAGAAEAVRTVTTCLKESSERDDEVVNLLTATPNWRPHLVGCIALLSAERTNRTDDALVEAGCQFSWVAPQLLATMSLLDPPNWAPRVRRSILDRQDPKAASAFQALKADGSLDLLVLSGLDRDYGGRIALGWRERIGAIFDDAGVQRTW